MRKLRKLRSVKKGKMYYTTVRGCTLLSRHSLDARAKLNIARSGMRRNALTALGGPGNFPKGGVRDIALGVFLEKVCRPVDLSDRANQVILGQGKPIAIIEKVADRTRVSTPKYQGKEFTTTIQANSKSKLDMMIKGLRAYAHEMGIEDFEVIQLRPDPDGGWEATIKAHNWNPIQWLKEKFGSKKKKKKRESASERRIREAREGKREDGREWFYKYVFDRKAAALESARSWSRNHGDKVRIEETKEGTWELWYSPSSEK